MSCIGCNQALTQQKINDQKILDIARARAKDTGEVISLYRDPEGVLCIAPSDGNTYPIIIQITPEAE